MKLFGSVLTDLVVFAATAFIVMLLWNALAPSIFDLRSITFPEGMGIRIFSNIVFKGGRDGAKT